jgi:hypothetical protein
MRRVKLMVLVGGLLVCGALGVVAAVAWSPEASVTEGAVERVRHGVTETGRVEAVTTEGQVRRVIRWKTRQGGVETQTVEGPLRLRIRGSTYFARPEGPISPSLHSMRLPGGIMTLPTTTVIQTVTETVQDTTTVIETVTVTTETGTTETGTTETGTSTSP